jgi:hypothetical protein
MMVAILLLAQVTAAPLSIVVSEAGPPREGCPNLELTQRAVNERLYGHDTEGGQWAARYVVTQSSVPGQNEVVRLELSDPEGRVRLRRELAIANEDCSDVAQAIALVLERYFADLAAEQTKESEPIAPPPVKPTQTPTPLARPEPQAPRAAETRLRAGLAGAFLPPDSAFALDLSLRFDHEWWSVGLRAAVPPKTRSERVQGGFAELSAWPLRLWFAADARWDGIELSIGPDFLVSLENGDTMGIADSGAGTRLVLGVGAQGNLLVSLAGPVDLALAAGAEATLPLAMSQFLLRESEREILKPHPIEGFIAAGLAFSFY